MYSSIIIDNPGTLTMLEKRIEIEQRLVEMIRSGDHAGVAQLFTTAREHFGSEVTAEANELFMRLLGVLNTLYGSNAVTLECSTTESRPGLLGRILNVFSQRNVNLTGINSVSLPNNRLQFAISFEQPRSSHSVRRALEEIEGWSEPIVTVIM